MDVCLFGVFALSGRGICDEPMPRPQESYQLWCVSECDQVKNKQSNLDTYSEQVGRRGKNCETKRKLDHSKATNMNNKEYAKQ
jgi:hypothetical protein